MRRYLLALALIGCANNESPSSQGEAGGGGKADSSEPSATGPVKYIEHDFAFWVRQAECAVGQGNTLIGTFKPTGFSASAMLASIKAEDAERGCPGRKYSTSKAVANATWQTFLADEPSITQELQDSCAAYGTDVAELKTQLSTAIADPTNIAVFSSVHDLAGNDDPVGCFYYRFYVLRKSGTAARLYFDWSD